MIDSLARLLQPMRTQLRQLLMVGTLTNSDDDGDIQVVQVRVADQEPLSNVQHAQPYGFASRPHEGARGLFAAGGGWRARLIALAFIDTRFRLKHLERGEIALYDDLGNHVWLKRDRIEVLAVERASVVAPEIDFAGAVNVTGIMTVNGVPGVADESGNSISMTGAGMVIDSAIKVTVSAPEVEVDALAIKLMGAVDITGSLTVNGVAVP